MSKLKYNPMDSEVLNTTLQAKEIKNIDKKYEYLLSFGISPEFAKPLEKMLTTINASTSEIINNKAEIIASNDRIFNQTESKRIAQRDLLILKKSA